MGLARRKSCQSLSVRITAGVLLLIALMTLVLIYLIGQRERTTLLTGLSVRLNDHAKLAGMTLRNDIESLRQSVLFLSQTPPVQGYIRADHGGNFDRQDNSALADWKRRLLIIFTAFAETHPHYYQIRYIGIADNGLELARVDREHGRIRIKPPEQLQHKGGRDYFQASLQLKPGEVYLSEINLNREEGKIEVPYVPTLRAVTPVYSKDRGELYGMLVINVAMQDFLDKLHADLPPGTQTYLMNSAGDYLLHPQAERSFGFDVGQRHRWQDDFAGTAVAPATPHKTHKQRLLPIASPEGPLYIAATRIRFDPEHPERLLTLVYGLPEKVINQQISATRLWVMAGLGAAGLLIGAIIFLILRHMFAPLGRLTEIARTIGAGRYQVTFPDVNGGEVGTFVQAFQEMLERIKRREFQVSQLNNELERSEAFANRIFETTPEAILVVDSGGRLVRVNHQAEHIFGYPMAEMLEQTVELLLPERFRQHHVGLRQGYLADAQPRMMGKNRALSGRRKDGSEFPVEVGLSPMRTDDGLYVIVSLVDISERKRVEQALRDSEERFRLIASNVKDYAIIMLDPQGRVLTWNEGAERIKGYRTDEIIGQSWECFYLPEERTAGLPNQILQCAKEKGHHHEEGWRLRKDGSRFYADVVTTAMHDPSGELIGFTEITRDITERRRSEEEIQRLNADLERRVQERTSELTAANRELDSFAYAVSHDLRAPLRAMSGFSQALLEDFGNELPDEASDYLNEITGASEKMGELIDGLLTLSRCTRGDLQRDEVDLSALADEISRELMRQTPGRDVDWHIEPGMTARGDVRMLKAVLRNLLENALKYSTKADTPQIRFYRECRDDRDFYCVADNGAGFNMDHADRLFKPFQRLHRQDEFEGTGIGLATVQRIIHRHGGQIQAASTPGQGAIFSFTLAPDFATEIEA